MGELSHSLLYQISFIEVAVKVPVGVEYPARPVDTGHSYFCIPFTKTVIFCLALLMSIRMAEPAFLGPGLASGCEPPGSDSVFAAVESVCVLVVAVEPGV